MFGIGFTEILLIAIIAILFLGPDKLPEAMVQIAKFFKSIKKTINEAKSSLEEEMRIADLKEEALSYKQKLDSAASELQGFKNISIDDIIDEPTVAKEKPSSDALKSTYADEAKPTTQVEPKMETVVLKKKEKHSIAKTKKAKKDNISTAKKSKEGDNV
ncbi:MAG: Sec-independent protein translocase protein TatB [Sulfurovum sp.]|nr:Sec-independent protein translocase protein TatB [Sulfurovum sp.]MCB4764665.1 Sec-independent protein translocase protein TatB [Sulfurovum sp.]MCB4774142.1 Sec-independent protein translocase protein TatB [Sulfurovum sp.]MCB4777594.1 Sec-independent protein translocase protein TatB [Sulfurovum sp.]